MYLFKIIKKKKKPDTEEYIKHNSNYMKLKRKQNYDRGSR